MLLSASVLACPAAAQQVTRAQVEHDLGGFEQAPSDAMVRGWGAEAPAMLMTIGNDPQAAPHVRQRAVYALRLFGARPGVKEYLRALAAVPGQGLYVLRAALDALVVGCNDVATAGGFLADGRAEVRDGAAWALARSTNPAARTLMADRLRVERDETVRRTLGDALQGGSVTH